MASKFWLFRGIIRANIILRTKYLMSLRDTAYCSIPYEVLYVIQRSKATWESPGRETLLPAAWCACGVMCLRRDIVFDSDFALQWYLPDGKDVDKAPWKRAEKFWKCNFPPLLNNRSRRGNNKFSTLKTAYFQRIYFLFFLFKISKCINA